MAWTNQTAGQTVAALIKQETASPWSTVKQWIAAGKVFVDGAREQRVDARLGLGQIVELRLAAPRPLDPAREGVLVYDDAHVVVIDKPSGVNSVPYEEREQGTAMDLIRGAWRRQGKKASDTPLHIVHRIDRATSGLLMFAKTKRAELELAMQLRKHECHRRYLCVAHGHVAGGTIESYLVPDRGDGLRGSARFAGQGKRAVTHVDVLAQGDRAALCRVQLETGRTHQIRIHLAEAGHPLVGEEVYKRDFENRGGRLLPATRLLLHAAELGFVHPVTHANVRLAAALPPDFLAALGPLGLPAECV